MPRPRLSANLGYLWTDRPLPDAIRAARAAGFDAVEMHWPEGDLPAIRAALDETGLPLVSINTPRGTPPDFGLAALPGREAEARSAIDRTLDAARTLGAGAVHVLAGRAEGPEARAAYLAALAHATASAPDLTILIEPLNHGDVPGYHLNRTAEAREIIARIGAPNLRLLFDCYHVQTNEGGLARRLADLLPVIGHVQIAAVPDRGPPDRGEIAYPWLLGHLHGLGYTGHVGAEYRPDGPTDASLGWLAALGPLPAPGQTR